jgi:hypothetical protein
LGGKASPLKFFIFQRMASVLQVAASLFVPIFRSASHLFLPANSLLAVSPELSP